MKFTEKSTGLVIFYKYDSAYIRPGSKLNDFIILSCSLNQNRLEMILRNKPRRYKSTDLDCPGREVESGLPINKY